MKRIIKHLLTVSCGVAFTVLALAASQVALCERRIVESVVDGDTIRVRLDRGRSELVRLIGIDAPELHFSEKFQRQLERANTDAAHLKALGERSHQVARSLMPKGTEVNLENDVEPRDRYGRRLAYVFLKDGTFVNREMVSRGYAHLLTFPPNVSRVDELRASYLDARFAKRGLWSYEEFAAQGPSDKKGKKSFPSGAGRVRNLPSGAPFKNR